MSYSPKTFLVKYSSLYFKPNDIVELNIKHNNYVE